MRNSFKTDTVANTEGPVHFALNALISPAATQADWNSLSRFPTQVPNVRGRTLFIDVYQTVVLLTIGIRLFQPRLVLPAIVLHSFTQIKGKMKDINPYNASVKLEFTGNNNKLSKIASAKYFDQNLIAETSFYFLWFYLRRFFFESIKRIIL